MDYQSLHMKTVADLRKLAKDLDVRIPAGTKKNIMIEMLLEADAPTRPEAKNAAPAPAEDKAESDRGAAASVGETENTVESAKDGAAKKGRGARKYYRISRVLVSAAQIHKKRKHGKNKSRKCIKYYLDHTERKIVQPEEANYRRGV